MSDKKTKNKREKVSITGAIKIEPNSVIITIELNNKNQIRQNKNSTNILFFLKYWMKENKKNKNDIINKEVFKLKKINKNCSNLRKIVSIP